MKTLKQKYGSKNCVAYVAAMAFNCPVEEFEKACETDADGRYSFPEFVRFAIDKGFYVGNVFMTPIITDENKTLRTELYIHNAPALVFVHSDYEANAMHSVFWDGQKVHDPDPRVEEKDLVDYNIAAWCPIYEINNL